MNIENIKELVRTFKNADYNTYLIAQICIEKDITPNEENIHLLNSIYNSWLKSDYTLLHEVFYNNEYDLFDDEEKGLLSL